MIILTYNKPDNFSTFSDENMHLVLPANQQRVMEAIYSTKAGNREKGLLLLKMLINELAEQQVDCVILGCTELSLYYDELRGQKSPLLIDPMDITADFIVNSYAS
jgi:aspartate/glutamate racemase